MPCIAQGKHTACSGKHPTLDLPLPIAHSGVAVVDTRNTLDSAVVEAAGLKYIGNGLPEGF
ncbi:hypothetical protein [Mycobacteroides abscessus]|uniref:hypothetical protein n=1 Tax=Mycobacteroides abscessus TaxID=36809 RepID=UPI000AB98784|nr:hypothetical protein [Mycobacteroides abscessus]MBN7441995.1 hypothetical protein [Mycobacteroides abscessus subsp. abscessus]